MHSFEREIMIEAPVESVWATLADIGTISAWNPGVKESHTTSEQADGLGATRYCDLGGKNFLDEKVVEFEPMERITMRVTDTNMPFETVDIRFRLKPAGSNTHVTVSPIYKLKYGPVGRMLNSLMVERTYSNGMSALLEGLKTFVEGEVV